MRKKKFGRIVSNASRVVLGKELRTSYSASKGALLSMSRTWALELAMDGITVNGVAPGPIATSAFWANNPHHKPESVHSPDHHVMGLDCLLQKGGTCSSVFGGIVKEMSAVFQLLLNRKSRLQKKYSVFFPSTRYSNVRPLKLLFLE